MGRIWINIKKRVESNSLCDCSAKTPPSLPLPDWHESWPCVLHWPGWCWWRLHKQMLVMCLCGSVSVTTIRRVCSREPAVSRRKETCGSELDHLPRTPAASTCHLSQLQTFENEDENSLLYCHWIWGIIVTYQQLIDIILYPKHQAEHFIIYQPCELYN